MSGSHDVIDLLSEDDDNEDSSKTASTSAEPKTSASKPPSNNNKPEFTVKNPYILDRNNLSIGDGKSNARPSKKRKNPPKISCEPRARQAGIVLEEDVSTNDQIVAAFVEANRARVAQGQLAELYTDETFPTLPSSIQGPKHGNKTVKCRCRGSQPAKLDYNGEGKPFYRCARRACKFYSNAFSAERFHWYRFGPHNGFCIVQSTGFSANDLKQGRVGDCWFLSALAVVAERPDLITRLFPCTTMNEYGMVQVNLFLDGYWKPVVIDTFLPCMIDPKDEDMLRQTLQASTGGFGRSHVTGTSRNQSSRYDQEALSDTCRDLLRDTRDFLENDMAKARGCGRVNMVTNPIQRPVTSGDLAYSKGLKNQLWIPLLEKAYAKSHGSYQAISGGHVAEAFLDLTGAPTRVFRWLDSPSFNFRDFWGQLLRFRKQRLPMGCGTDQSQVGIIGMHAYSILDVVEVKNVSQDFYEVTDAAHGGMSGFGTDGTVRLLQIRNPHGKSEWKGHFSDRSDVWEKLRKYSGGRRLSDTSPSLLDGRGQSSPSELERTMKDDGKFWIDYDSFLQGFGNVDVVLAFLGNHAKSFAASFPAKKSNQRCTTAFEVSLLDEPREVVELYVMGIQKTRRGAGHGRTDRKVSYKVSDLGLLVGESQNDPNKDVFDDSRIVDGNYWLHHDFESVRGQMFGFQRNGHHRLVLRRSDNKSFVVMPVSFGHPTATDAELSFVLRFVSDAPLLIRELPAVPRLDKSIQKFCLSPSRPFPSKQGRQTVLLQGPSFRVVQVDCLRNGGGIVFVYLCVNENVLGEGGSLSFSMEARSRGMSCRTAEGLIQFETIAKGKMFESAWRKFDSDFHNETQSRLLAVLFQSGQDYEFGSISFKAITASAPKAKTIRILEEFMSEESLELESYANRGIFNGCKGSFAFQASMGFAQKGACTTDQPISPPATQNEDWQVQQVLELSKQESIAGYAPDAILEAGLALAFAASKTGMNTTHGGIPGFQTQTEDDQLRRAIELSLQDSTPAVAATVATVSTPAMSQGREVLDLTSARSTIVSINSDLIVSVDDDGTPASFKADSIEEKRRLAAEAAMRRFGRL